MRIVLGLIGFRVASLEGLEGLYVGFPDLAGLGGFKLYCSAGRKVWVQVGEG